jgi:Cu/Zn superoxide dismutase
MKTTRLILAALALATLAGTTLTAAGAATTAVTIDMKALNNSNENGTATLTQESGGVKVVVTLKNAPDTVQPTHIHAGTCTNINKAPEYALESVTKGTSTTVVQGVSLDDLLKGHYAINVHKSADDLGTYVSCGDIKAS